MSGYSWYELCRDARAELRKNVIEYKRTIEGDDIGDVIHETADNHVPLYTYDILQYAAKNLSLAVDEPEIGPAFDGLPTPVNIIAANIYEAISADLWEYWYDTLENEVTELENEEYERARREDEVIDEEEEVAE